MNNKSGVGNIRHLRKESLMEKSCAKCVYIDRGDEPCASCVGHSMFEPVPDNVNHPAHYEQSCSLECIQVMEVMFGAEGVTYFCLCNAFKYMWRYKNKNGLEDLKKAKWYLDYIKTDYILCGDQYEAMGELLEQLMEKIQLSQEGTTSDTIRGEQDGH